MSVLLKVVLHIVFGCIFEWRCFSFVAGLVELGYICLSEVLIVVSDGFRHVNIFNFRFFAHCSEDCVGQIVPSAGLAGTDIEEPCGLLIFEKEKRHIDGVFYIDKIAKLLAIPELALV